MNELRVSGKPADETCLADRPCYSTRLMAPFLNVLRTHPALAPVLADASVDWQFEGRVPISMAHGLLEAAIEATGDPDLGLQAAQQIVFGDVGALDYLVCSDATVRDAIESASAYARLVSDALNMDLEVVGQQATLRLETSVAAPRAGSDFLLGSLFRNYCRAWFGESLGEVVVVFRHPQPAHVSGYQRTFESSRVQFSHSCDGFVFPAALLDARLPSADARLHDVMQRHADDVLSTLPEVESAMGVVRSRIMAELTKGNPSVSHIARQLGMSSRTLGRRLEREGTTFKALLDDVRKQLALKYVGGHDWQLSEIAASLGFSQTAAFHRAFRRWTGVTPLQYRRQHLR